MPQTLHLLFQAPLLYSALLGVHSLILERNYFIFQYISHITLSQVDD